MDIQTAKPARPCRVLAVEDDAAISTVIAEVLADEGFAVTVAPTATDATTCLAAGGVDLVLLDLRLPGLSGWDFLELLRETQTAAIVVMITAEHDARRRAAAAGVDGFLTKPFALENLVDVATRARDGLPLLPHQRP